MPDLGPATVTITETKPGEVSWSYPSSSAADVTIVANVGVLRSWDVELRDSSTRCVELPRAVMIRNPVLGALEASEAAVHGRDEVIDSFARTHLTIPAATVARWREAVSLALMSDWHTVIATSFGDNLALNNTLLLRHLREEVRRVHRQLQPLWERKIDGRRVALLEAPAADRLTLRDLIGGGSEPDKAILRTVLDDLRLEAVLHTLTPAEQKVARAWAYGDAPTWQEAARRVGASDPVALGERVRRKLRRQGQEYLRRRPAATASGLWLPPQATPTEQKTA